MFPASAKMATAMTIIKGTLIVRSLPRRALSLADYRNGHTERMTQYLRVIESLRTRLGQIESAARLVENS
jgi:hypothetical protein